MRIQILDSTVCDNCAKKTCAVNDVIERITFSKFRSERYCCPIRLLEYGPTKKQLDQGFIDISVAEDDVGCIYCAMCVIHCWQKNLKIIDYDNNNMSFVERIAKVDTNNHGISNVLASLYMHQIFNFAANTSINKAMSFDGFVDDSDGKGYFVEVDLNDDSLECCRRLLGDILTQNHLSERKVDAGIMVLSHLPKPGSRDIFTLAEKIATFPHTKHLQIYVTTFLLLRHFAMNVEKNKYKPDMLFYGLTTESIDEYKKRLQSNRLLSEQYFNSLF